VEAPDPNPARVVSLRKQGSAREGRQTRFRARAFGDDVEYRWSYRQAGDAWNESTSRRRGSRGARRGPQWRPQRGPGLRDAPLPGQVDRTQASKRGRPSAAPTPQTSRKAPRG
jgi:hypothetical protein